MPSQQQRHHVVPDLLPAQRGSIVVTRAQQPREQVVPIVVTSPFRDHLVDDGIESFSIAAQAPVPGRRQPRRQQEAQAVEPVEVVILDRSAEARDLPDPRCDVGTEEHAGDDPQGQRGHLRADIDRRAVAPAVRLSVGGCDDGLIVAREPLAAEGRRDEPSRSQPAVALVGQQSPAEHTREDAHAKALAVILRVRGQHLGHLDRSERHADPQRSEPQGHQVAVVISPAAHRRQGVRAVLSDRAEQQIAAGTGGGRSSRVGAGRGLTVTVIVRRWGRWCSHLRHSSLRQVARTAWSTRGRHRSGPGRVGCTDG
jgi:hypothetical protein